MRHPAAGTLQTYQTTERMCNRWRPLYQERVPVGTHAPSERSR